MIKPVRLSYAYSLLLILGQIGLVLFFYKKLPNEIATHFNILNEPDFFMPKALGSGLFIVITLGVFALFSSIAKSKHFLERPKRFQAIYFFLAGSVLFLIFICQLLIFLCNSNIECPVSWIVLTYTGFIVIPLAGLLIYRK